MMNSQSSLPPKGGRAIDQENVGGIYWKDIDWPPMEVCDYCGIGDDWMMAGHLASCRYYYYMQESPAGRNWLRHKIQEAIDNGWVKKNVRRPPNT